MREKKTRACRYSPHFCFFIIENTIILTRLINHIQIVSLSKHNTGELSLVDNRSFTLFQSHSLSDIDLFVPFFLLKRTKSKHSNNNNDVFFLSFFLFVQLTCWCIFYDYHVHLVLSI
jgi:hypothetical protein